MVTMIQAVCHWRHNWGGPVKHYLMERTLEVLGGFHVIKYEQLLFLGEVSFYKSPIVY